MSKPVLAIKQVPEGAEQQRLDCYAAAAFEVFPSRKAAYKAAKQERLLVNGVIATPHHLLRAGDKVSLCAAPEPPAPWQIHIPVALEEDSFAVVVKPAGIPTSGNYPRTLVRALSPNLQASPLADALPAPHPVHRLDSPTGGLVLVAKTAGAAMDLGQQFEQRGVFKRYRALLQGKLEGEGLVSRNVDGRAATTRFVVLSQHRSLSLEWLTEVDLYPLSGRTHQLRRHMASLGHPIIGDATYSGTAKVLRGKGLFLWAAELQFLHPLTHEPITCSAEPPPKFSTYPAREKRRWEQQTDLP